MKFVLNRNKTVATRTGHVIEFKKGEPTYVPKVAWVEVQAIGAIPEDDIPEPEQRKDDAPTDAAERRELLFAAFEEVVAKNRREDFTAAGSPHARVLSDIVGFAVEAKERDVAWAAFKQRDED